MIEGKENTKYGGQSFLDNFIESDLAEEGEIVDDSLTSLRVM